MKITKLVNNNIVISEDMQGREIIVMGRGLGFGKKPGMEIDVGKIEKVFRLSSEGENQKLVDMIQDIPMEHITAADRIIDYAKSMLGVLSLPDFAYGELQIPVESEVEKRQILEKLDEAGLLYEKKQGK